METIITTQQGAVQGALSQDQQTVNFRGVPYAQPPVGALRFRRPQEHAPWEGVRDCTAFGPRCPQADLAPWTSTARSSTAACPTTKARTACT